MKRKHKIVCILLVLALFLPLLTACADHFDTTDLAEYGHIHGNGKQIDRLAQEDFDTYFPAEIDPSWRSLSGYYFYVLSFPIPYISALGTPHATGWKRMESNSAIYG